MQDGIAVIKRYAAKLSLKPGVYQMQAENGDVLYIGKAKSLKKRVLSYTQPNRLSDRLIRMISNTVSMSFVETHTEAEALLLEANLIKTRKPRYNILLRDDKSFPYILLTKDHDYPRLMKHRGAKTAKGEYFGPFASAGAVNQTLNTLQRAFLIRNCTDTYFANRTRPCLQYHIKRCTAPCMDLVSKQDYAEQIHDAARYLNGKSRDIQEKLASKMQQASDDLDFEQAAILRDRIKALNAIQSKQDINIPDLPDLDAISILRDGGKTCVQVFFFRGGQSFGNKSYFPRASAEDTDESVLASFIGQFYDNKPIPKEILTSLQPENCALLEEALSAQSGHKVSIKTNVREARKRLIEWAKNNTKTSLHRHLSETTQQRKSLEAIADLFDLDTAPNRIEVYDNSHISGSDMVGAMIVAGPDGFMKNQYRKFNMKSANKQDDFDMMREVMTRRFSRALKEDGQGIGSENWPDLLLIDGGKGQLSAVLETLEELGIKDDVHVVGISKGPDRNAGREEFHMEGRPAFRLPHNDPTLYFLQRLRDESHRFVIGTHRTKRSKNMTKSSLDQVPGIGPKRKKALLMHFGSAKAVEGAGIADLKAVEGISDAFAAKLYAYFHE